MIVNEEAEILNKDIHKVVSNLNKNFDKKQKDKKKDQVQIDLLM